MRVFGHGSVLVSVCCFMIVPLPKKKKFIISIVRYVLVLLHGKILFRIGQNDTKER